MAEFNWENIVRCVVRNAKRQNTPHTSKSPYWFIVSELCGVGSTSAHELCERFGIDPAEKLPECEFDEVVRLCRAEMDDQTQGPSETCAKMWQHIEERMPT
jgi:hypothetical protein